MKLMLLWDILNLHRIILSSSATGTRWLKPFRNGSQKKTTGSKWIWQENCTEGLEQHHPRHLQSLHKSMPQRMQAVIDAEGGHTKYQESL